MCKRLSFTLILVFFCGQSIYAQPNQENETRSGSGFRLDPVSQALDTNHDGELSETELEKAPEVLRTLDQDKDGNLSLDELMPRFSAGPFGPGGRRGGGPNRTETKLADKHDKDGNGYLDASERKSALDELKSLNVDRQGGRRRGPRGSAREPGRPGPNVAPDQAKAYPDHALYDPTILRTIFIQFDSENWEEEMAAFKQTDVEVPATVVVDGKPYPMVGLSFRGQSSFDRVPSGLKRSLNLSMDHVDSDQRLYGYKTLNLLNCSGDSSMMSSALYSFIAKDFLPAPKANFVKVVINGESWGIYSNVQQYNKDFLKEHYRTASGARWKVPGNPGADGGLRYLGDELDGYKERFEIKSKDKKKSWRALVDLCKVLNETPTSELPDAIEPLLNVDGVLRFLAMDVALVNSDGYWTRASDYNLYRDPTGVFHVIPHDMNEAFVTRGARGSRQGGGGPGGFGPPPGFGPPNDFGPPPGLDDDRPGNDRRGGIERGRRDDSGGRAGPGRPRAGFGGGRRGGPGGHGDATLDPLIGIDSDRMPLRSKILAVPAYRQKYLQYIRTIAEDKLDVETLGPIIQRFRDLLLEEVKADTRAVSSFDAFAAMSQAPGPSASQAPSLYTFLKERRAFLLAHDEISQVESIKIAAIESEVPTVTSVGPKPSISISEVLASNKKSNQDPQGDHDDWIELFNHGNVVVDLSGMFLSDDPTNMFKWRIPDGTLLEAGKYLVVWADEDGGDAGLHANFKLSAKGESVTLVFGNTLVDKVEFEAQKADESTGRLNGSSDVWQKLRPTPGEPNRRLK